MFPKLEVVMDSSSAATGEEGGERPEAAVMMDEEDRPLSETEQLRLKLLDDSIQYRCFNFIPILIEEIGLEGLDGITLQALWVRLQHRPAFILPINEKTQLMFWNSIRFDESLQFYELLTPRPDLVFYNRMDFCDERGNCYEPLSAPEEIYLYSPVDDGLNRGSCPNYFTRRNISELVRGLSYENMGTFGNSLVIVASQEVRSQVLARDVDIEPTELVLAQYCMLERIGRARYHGESARGKVSVTAMKIDPKTLFYMRKVLMAKNLITKQTFTMKFGVNRVSSLISILHLPRFHVRYESASAANARNIFNSLKAARGHRIEAAVIKANYGKHILQPLLNQEYGDIFEYTDVSMAELHPEKLEGLVDPEKIQFLHNKPVKVIRLKDPSFNFDGFVAKKNAIDEDAAGGKEDVDAEAPEKDVLLFDEIRIQTSVLFQIWKYLLRQSAIGCTRNSLADDMNVFNLDSRSITRLTTRHKLATVVLEDSKKTKVQRYIYFKCSEANKLRKQLALCKSSQERGRSFGVFPSNSFDISPELIIIPQLSAAASSGPTTRELGGGSFISEEIDESEILPIEHYSTADRNQQQPEPEPSYLSVYLGAGKSAAGSMVSSVTTDMSEIVDSEANTTLNSTMKEKNPYHVQNSLRTTAYEEKVFIPVQSAELISPDGHVGSYFMSPYLNYERGYGWQVYVEHAEINPKIIKAESSLVKTMKSIGRAKFVYDLIQQFKFLIGCLRLLHFIRKHESQLQANSRTKSTLDRRSLYRLLKELQREKQINMWRISLISDKEGKSKVYAAFTPYDVTINDVIIKDGIETLMEGLQSRQKITKEQRLLNLQLQKFGGGSDPQNIKPPSVPGIIKRRRKKQNAAKFVAAAFTGGSTTTATSTAAMKKARRVTSRLFRKYPSLKPTKHRLGPERKLIYDDVDLMALRLMKKQRAYWSPVEDKAIAYLFIASTLFIPDYNYLRLIMFNSHQIRDVMHMKYQESRCKTSAAVRRRFHFLMKKSSVKAKFRQTLQKALDDEALRAYVRDTYPKACISAVCKANSCDVSPEGLLEVFEYLEEKFDTGTVRESPILQSFAKYENSDVKPVLKRRADSSASPIASPTKRIKFEIKLVNSEYGESGGEEEEVDGAELHDPMEIEVVENFRVEEEEDKDDDDYDEDLDQEFAYNYSVDTCQVSKPDGIIECITEPESVRDIEVIIARTLLTSFLFSSHSDETVNILIGRIDQTILYSTLKYLKDKNILSLPKGRFVPSPLLKRRVQIYFTSPMYNYANHILRRFSTNRANVTRFNATEVINLASSYLLIELLTLMLHSNIKVDINIAPPVNAVDFTNKWKKILDKPPPESPLERKGKRSAGFGKKFDLSSDPSSETYPHFKAPALRHGTNSSSSDVLEDFKIPRSPSSGSGHGHNNKSVTRIVMVSSNDNEDEDNNGDEDHDDEEEDDSTMNTHENGSLVLGRKTTSFNLRQYKAHFVSKLGSIHNKPIDPNVFNLTLPNAYVQFEPFTTMIMDEEIPSADKVVDYMQRTLKIIVPNLEDMPHVKIPSQFISIARVIYAAGETGVLAATLEKQMYRNFLKEAVDYLLESELVYLVGSEFIRLVGFPFVGVWCVPIGPRSRTLARPWITCHGELNWWLVDQLLCSLIGYVELHPGISVRKVSYKLIPILTPVEAILLLKILHHFNIIHLREVSETNKVNLFTNAGNIFLFNAEDICLESELLVELTEFHIIKYSILQNRLESKLGTNMLYLTKENDGPCFRIRDLRRSLEGGAKKEQAAAMGSMGQQIQQMIVDL